MNKIITIFAITIIASCLFIACQKESSSNTVIQTPLPSAIDSMFQGTIDTGNLENYANQFIPDYIKKDNSGNNFITDKGATLGRVLFYDKNLSITNKLSCASCHQQIFAFSDTAVASLGVNGLTGRHSMRLVNARFGEETKFFWDERAASLEQQTTRPIQDHNEMGFSGQNGDSSINDLITKLSKIGYYKELFSFVYGSPEITENKMQLALAQFIRSIQSFDSKYDAGRSLVDNDTVSFPNFTNQENTGKNLFMSNPIFDANSERIGGGLGCNQCHRAPEFDIDPNSKSNGFGGSLGGVPDFTNTRAPSLRNLTKSDGTLNSPMMHTAIIKDLKTAVGHYGNLTGPAINNNNLDSRLKPNGTIGQQLHLTAQEFNSMVAFLKTLGGTDVYINKKWSNPFPH